jgi:hypothetical protein
MFAMASKKSQFILEKSEPENVMSQICVMHLLANCHVCLHGSNAISRVTFNYHPPTLEAYLTN